MRGLNGLVSSAAGAKGRTLAILALCNFFVGWSSLVTVPLVPAIANGTGMAAESGALLVSAYALAFLLTAPVFGVISDGFGRKSVIVAGMLVLAAGTALTGLGNGLATLLAARAVTGIGAGMVAPSVFALVGDLFPYEERGRATGVVSAMLVASNVLGVPLSGLLAEAAGWRWAFFAIAALAAVALAAALAGLPKDRPGQMVPGDEPDLASAGMKAALATPASASRCSRPSFGMGASREPTPTSASSTPVGSAWTPRTSASCSWWRAWAAWPETSWAVFSPTR